MVLEVVSWSRYSQDKCVNVSGQSLLAFCAAYDLSILNGLFGESSGKFTYVSSAGSSVIDYCLATRDLMSIFTSLLVVESVTSPHMCIELKMTGNNMSVQEEEYNVVTKIIWDESFSNEYIRNFQECNLKNHCQLVYSPYQFE